MSPICSGRSVRAHIRYSVCVPQSHAPATQCPRMRTMSGQHPHRPSGTCGECFTCGARWNPRPTHRPGPRRDPPCLPAKLRSRPRPIRSHTTQLNAGGAHKRLCRTAVREKAYVRCPAHFADRTARSPMRSPQGRPFLPPRIAVILSVGTRPGAGDTSWLCERCGHAMLACQRASGRWPANSRGPHALAAPRCRERCVRGPR